jgi:hypothetical protein
MPVRVTFDDVKEGLSMPEVHVGVTGREVSGARETPELRGLIPRSDVLNPPVAG